MDKKRRRLRLFFLILLFAVILWGGGYVEPLFADLQNRFSLFCTSIINLKNDIKAFFTIMESLQEEKNYWQEEARKLTEENFKLKLLLENLKKREEASYWFKELEGKNINFIYAEIIGRDPIKWDLEFRINKGEKEKIKVGMPVIYKDQLVGKVVSVGSNYSVVKTIMDPSFIVGVTILETKDQGVLKGAIDHMEMQYLFSDHGIKLNCTLVTSGIDEYFPYGIRVGYITEIEKKELLVFSKIRVIPFIDFSNINGVAICENF
ncbi:MAG TPA: rod shape-determining protein MreC [Dictyoglomaceae bacterium]|nr:rod shape-determining protein MreC [Dictyoglomaceae bacterium]HOL39633.1 rod shape-determining protein MreC [Dictyoglomaceae bacterium]HOP95145.1 rod shape-determining protein MreC [Dictyoglomaceae bacterium]HPP15205.1 rod shape-determining protein MreC [Dictyoglomaceae bacterium]HPU42611.1 rod shape-determining protein MreC [Dictyoglomaceae bacterium]